jgi:hypothetical protein
MAMGFDACEAGFPRQIREDLTVRRKAVSRMAESC